MSGRTPKPNWTKLSGGVVWVQEIVLGVTNGRGGEGVLIHCLYFFSWSKLLDQIGSNFQGFFNIFLIMVFMIASYVLINIMIEP